MSKSRQPGKPAKLASSGRKLVSAFRPTSDTTPVEDNEFTKAAKEIYLGLAVFRFIFGNEDETQESPFHGFSPHEIKWASDKSSIRRRQVEDEHRARGVLFSPFMVGPRRNPLLPMSSLMTAPQKCSNDFQSKQIFKSEEKKVSHVPKPSSDGSVLRKNMLKHHLQKNKCAGKSNDAATGSLNPARAVIRKFVLPVRSAHSSRVIKPNKRFRDIDGDTASCDSSEGIRVKKIRVSVDTDDESSSSWVGKRTGDSSDEESMSGWSSSAGSSVKDEDYRPRPQGKVILRKAKLKVQEPDPPTIKGPFSSGALVPQKVVCGVCGAVRYYRYINQARKFGIYSCESCRKFITKILSALGYALKKTDLQTQDILTCRSGTGECALPQYGKHPVTGEVQHRCKACWLKLCLQSYHMPQELSRALVLWLPKFMRTASSQMKPKNSTTQKYNYYQSFKYTGRNNGKQAIAKHIKLRIADAIARKDAKNKKSDSNVKLKPSTLANKLIGKRKEEIKVRKVGRPSLKMKKEEKLAKIQRKRDEKLVKLHKLKGPRVKHVCRSASLVLGQPVATFTDTSPSKQKSGSGKLSDDGSSSLTSDLSRSNRSLDDTSNTSGKCSEAGSRMRQSFNDSEGKNKSTLSKTSGNSDSAEEGLEGKARTLQDLSRQHYELVNGETIGDDLGLISIHFWESYDPEEVGKNGFALIGIGEASIPSAICFICGSAGLDKLIHCVCCCEPYHRYCVEVATTVGVGCDRADWWTVDWVCPRCTLCRGCGRGGGAQVACQKCHKSYHTECLAADRVASRLHSADRPWVCLSCLCCKSCNQAEVYKFVGNLPLCRVCFKLRQKGNFCPLCQRCYDENDFDTKMMECERCKCWVHAKCEGLSNEKYHILSILPDSVEFVCRMCCKMPPAPWWLAVETEMKAGFLAVLKSLSKNRKACDLLKCSPTKMSYPVCTCGGGVRRRVLRYPDTSEQSDVESPDVKVQNENQNVKCEEECLKSLPNFSSENSESLVCDPKSEISENQLALCDTRTKYNVRDGSVVVKSEELQLKLDSDTISYQNADEKPAQFSPHATSQSDSGIGSTDDELKSTNDQCICLELESWNKTPPSLLTIKKKVNSNEYDSLDCFNKEMEDTMSRIQNQELLKIYHQTMEDIFPWFNPNGNGPEGFDSSTRVNHHTDTNKTIDAISDKKPEEPVMEDVTVTLKGKLDLSSDYYYSIDKPLDSRICMFCKQLGEGKPVEEGRLLYCGQNDWVHINCALWSNEVFEEIDGSLQNVQSAVSRSRHIWCSHCSKKGASVGCCNRTCPEAYHFNCAKESGCVFYEDKSLFCAKHKDDCVSSRPLVTGPDFLVSRPVYVELERKKKKNVPRQDINVMIGSLTINSLGDFDPDLSDQESSIIPCNFQCTRLFWSSVEPWRLVKYSIQTKIVYTVCDSLLEDDDNYTIDHSLNQGQTPEISLNNEIEKKEDFFVVEKKESYLVVDESEIKETLDLILDHVCTKEEEDPQASADLLPPELKEAIFEDLPHDLLDGISMQDIFPKLMNFESTGLEFKPEKECKPAKTNTSIQSPDKVNINYDHYSNIFDSKVTLKRLDLKQTSETEPNQVTKRKLRTRSIDVKKVDKSEGKENSKKWSLSKILQIDGTGDDTSDTDSSVSESSSSLTPLKIPSSIDVQQCQQNSKKSHSYSLDFYSSSECSSPARDDDITWKLGQLDGTTDFSSGKDNNTLDEDPVKCTRCHRTYRTAQSLERHLQTCNVDFLSCSESDSSEEDKASSPEVKVANVGDSKSNFHLEDSRMKINTTETKSEYSQYQMPSDHAETKSITLEKKELSYTCNKITSGSPNNIIQSSLSNDHNITPHCTVVLNKLENYHTYPAKQKIIRPSYECEDSFAPVSPTCGRTSPVKIRAMKRPIKTYSRKKQVCTSSISSSGISQQKPVEYQLSNPSPALIIQQMPTHNVMPSYIDSLQNQPAVQANNIQYQYITMDVQEKPQQIPVTVQIQPQISLQPMIGPTVLGTLIQPNGVEQLVVNTPAPTVEVMNQQPTNVYITNMNPQPMYMGMETVISNTVMSTSQFVSGMITGSSYSATTTQVFQTAKPVIDVPQGYVVVNAPTNPVPTSVPQTIYPPSNSQPWTYNYQETYKVKERTTYQQVTRQMIQEDLDSMKMVNSTQEAIFINKPVVQEVTVEKTKSIQKTLPVPGLINTFSGTNPASVNAHSNQSQYSQEKMVINNCTPLCSWSEPKIKEICDEEVRLPCQASSLKVSPPTNQIVPAIKNDNMSKIVSVSKPEITVQRLNQIINNSENKIGSANGNKPIVIVRKSPIKPVISKVKANPNEKTNVRSVIYVNASTGKPNPLSDGPILNITKEEVLPVKEQNNSSMQKIEKCFNSNSSLKQESMKAEPLKKTEIKRIPLKENKVVGNKSKPCKDGKKNTIANISHPKLMYEITSPDGVSICSQDIEEAWQKIFDAVQEGRAKKRLPPLPQNSQKSHLRLLGLDNNSVKYLLEQLPGVKSCKNYKPVYHKTKLFGHSEQLRDNPTGCARTEPISNKKRKYDMFSWLASRHRRPPKLIVNTETEIVNGISRRATNTSLPMAMRFRHLKETSREAVGVFRSDIHGRGLFCLRDIDGGEMVIEYAGEVIRAGLTDKREHYYTAKGIGCYMFRIDDHFVVDATMHGNAARFINHSCEPNCFSKVVDILGKKHILIFALRKIIQGEELTYDYKFPLEDEKISCHCLSRKCRKYLN